MAQGFSDAKKRTLGLLGASKEARHEAVNLHLPEGKSITSADLIAAIAKLDVSALVQNGLPAVAVFDFDQTLMAGDVAAQFGLLAAAEQQFRPEANEGVVTLLASLNLAGLDRAKLDAQDVNANVLLAYELLHQRLAGGDPAQTVSTAEFFYVLAAAMRGMSPGEAKTLGEKLFEVGPPGHGPYRNHLFDPSSGSHDSAGDLVAMLQQRGVSCHVVSAGLRFLASIGARYVGIPDKNVYGAVLETSDGIYTGRVADVVAVGKPNLVRQAIGTAPLFAFGDTAFTDGPMLKLALVKGFMVDPQPAFLDMVERQSLDFMTLTFRPHRR